jgi:diguanylate cyclase (GGDEF)-like protein
MNPRDRQFLVVDADGRVVAESSSHNDPSALPAIQWAAVLSDLGIRAALDDLQDRPAPRKASIPIDLTSSSGASHVAVATLVGMKGPDGPLILIELLADPEDPTRESRDSLTGLPDRRALAARAEEWRRAAAPSIPRFAALFLDLDQFKPINDLYGHAVGDAVLQQLATRWLGCLRDGDLVARYGGDEFVLLVRDVVEAGDVEVVMHRVSDATREPVAVGELTLSVSATIGWATPKHESWTIEEVIAAADRDMYARRRSGDKLNP